LPSEYKKEHLELVEKGVANLQHHIKNLRKFGVPVVVGINRFSSDTDAELELVKRKSIEAGAFDAVVANHWAEGNEIMKLELIEFELLLSFIFVFFFYFFD